VQSGNEWKLGPEPQRDHELVPLIQAQRQADLSTLRLTRTLQVITVEHLAWIALVSWALITRFLQLAMAPLAPYEARHALFEYDLVNGTNWASQTGYHPAGAGWVHLLQAVLFAAGGASDVTARLIFVVAGLSMIAMAFLMRPHVGRAAAIAVAGLIAISPTFTYFSRASAIAIVAAALAMGILATFLALPRRPTLMRAIGLGCMSGLLTALGATGLATAGILAAALALVGLYLLIVSNHACLNSRIWLVRYGSVLVGAIVAAGLFWFGSQAGLASVSRIVKNTENVWVGFRPHEYLAGLDYYVPGLLLYEFLIGLTAIIGVIAIVTLQAWSRLALFSLLWLLLSFAYFLGSHERESERLVMMLLPLVIVGAAGIEYLHRTRAWPYARAVLIMPAAITVYVQLEANFIYAAPTTNEAVWARHANLYWRDGATTIEARTELSRIRKRFPEEGGTVFICGQWRPSLRWYLRQFRPTSSYKMADLVIASKPQARVLQDPGSESSSSIDLEQSWNPALKILSPARAVRFVFAADAWTPLLNHSIIIFAHPRTDLAPSLIMPPSSPTL
jgi:predicted membrane-bound mannosyltransferase